MSDYKTVALGGSTHSDAFLEILDQTLLPGEVKMLRLDNSADIAEAIYKLRVRGAPAIGVAAAIGVYVCAARGEDFDEVCRVIESARPTAVNLSWAVGEMRKAGNEVVIPASEPESLTDSTLEIAGQARNDKTFATFLDVIRAKAFEILSDDCARCRGIGELGASLILPGMGVLTHCNAGRLATAGIGTALAPIYTAHSRGVPGIKVYCDETRPLLQGARLTAWELSQAGIDATLLCDNMAAQLMASGAIDIIFVGADRIAANGDTANKIGTLGVAVMAKHFGIPFYVCAPRSTFDESCASGSDIIIEQRSPDEVAEMWYSERMAPRGIGIINPAFDVTPRGLISGIITEEEIIC
jgi:methylthioribose-1-phosphate isomerase